MYNFEHGWKTNTNTTGHGPADGAASQRQFFQKSSRTGPNLHRSLFVTPDSVLLPANLLIAAEIESMNINLMPFFERVELKPSEYIYRSGDNINYLYFPETAVFSEYQILEDGRTIEIAMTGNEGLAGIVSFLSAAPVANWTQTSIAGSALKIDAGIFRREFNNHGPLQAMIFDYLNSYVRQVSQRLICNSYHTVEQRFCGWLKMIVQRCGKFKLPLTQEQIARSLGTHRPTVTGVAKHLQRENIIDYCRGKISVLDPLKLSQAACECEN